MLTRERLFQPLDGARTLSVQRLLIGVLLVAAVLGMLGGTWDAAWHVSRQREGLFSPPHLLLYSSTTLALIASAAGLFAAWTLRWPFPGPHLLRDRPLPLGLALAAVGAFVVIGSAPLDELWHRTFGRDVDVWSFPHILALIGGVGIDVGAILAVSADRRKAGRLLGWHYPVLLGFLAVLGWVAMFSLNWYTLVLARLRDSVQYPLLAALVGAPLLMVGAMALGRGGATMTAITYTLVTAGMHFALAQFGFALLPFPPLIIVPALAIDIILWADRTPSWRRGLLAAASFAPLFYAAEAFSLTWLPHPLLSVPSDPLALSYYEAVMSRPWDLAHILIALPLAVLVGAVAGLGGWWIGVIIQWSQGLRSAFGATSATEVGQVRGVTDHVSDSSLRVQIQN